MGVADSIPGVSGGTMALILGIYPKLIDAIGSLGPSFLRRVSRGAFRGRLLALLRNPAAAGDSEEDRDAVRVLFLAFLGVGMVAAIVTGSRVIPGLLDRYPAEMKAFFFGLVLFSVSVPLRMIGRRTGADYGILVVAAGMAWLLVGGAARNDLNARGNVEVILAEAPAAFLVLDPIRFFVAAPGNGGAPDIVFAPPAPVRFEAGQQSATVPILARMAGEWGNLSPGSIREVHGAPAGTRVIQTAATRGGRNPSRLSLFMAGFVAISAMVLPGISGSFILLLFGLYHFVSHSLRMAIFQGDSGAVATVVTVLVAIIVGLMTITRVIRVLLTRFRRPTLAALSGLMIGSLRVLWPFVEVGLDGAVRNVLPSGLDGATLAVLGAFLFGSAAVLGLESLGRRSPDGARSIPS